MLDLGVGPGTSSLEPGRERPTTHVGLDLSRRMLRRAAAQARRLGVALPLVRADALALPLRAGSLDGVTGHSFLYLVADPGAALREAWRAVRPGGRVAFLEPRAAPGSLRAALGRGPRAALSMLLWRGMSGLHRRFGEAELASLLAGAGFAGARAWTVLDGFGVVATAERP